MFSKLNDKSWKRNTFPNFFKYKLPMTICRPRIEIARKGKRTISKTRSHLAAACFYYAGSDTIEMEM